MMKEAISYSGGIVKHLMRIYAAFGPILLYAVSFLLAEPDKRKLLSFLFIFLAGISVTFLATDTLRAISVVNFPIILFAAAFIKKIFDLGKWKFAILCIIVQIFYSWLVFGHLISFEESLFMNQFAIVLSSTALLLCFFFVFLTFNLKGSSLSRKHFYNLWKK
jgi:hypothetical protein